MLQELRSLGRQSVNLLPVVKRSTAVVPFNSLTRERPTATLYDRRAWTSVSRVRRVFFFGAGTQVDGWFQAERRILHAGARCIE